MYVSHTFVDVSRFRQANYQPADIIELIDGAHWLVVNSPMETGEGRKPPKWVQASQGDAVRVPLWPYLVLSEDDVALAALACELGGRAVGQRPPSGQVLEMHITTGGPTEWVEQPDDKVKLRRYWVGIALRVE